VLTKKLPSLDVDEQFLGWRWRLMTPLGELKAFNWSCRSLEAMVLASHRGETIAYMGVVQPESSFSLKTATGSATGGL